MLLVLIYIHGVFSQNPTNCLVDLHEKWPKDGILRVEIINNASSNYTLVDSYKKEYGELYYSFVFEDKANETKEGDPNKENVTHYKNAPFHRVVVSSEGAINTSAGIQSSADGVITPANKVSDIGSILYLIRRVF